MAKIYVNQTNLILDFNLSNDITDGVVIIQRRNPSGVEIESLPVQIIDAQKGLVRFTSTEIPKFTVSGTYKMWAFVTFPNGKIIYGEPCELIVNKIGT